MKFPKDTSYVGLVIDKEHIGAVGPAIGLCKNPDLIGLLSAFRQGAEQRPFVVVCGHPSKQTGIVGGIAPDWETTKALYRFCVERMNEQAEKVGAFSGAWMLYLTEDRQQELLGAAAEAQATRGNA